MYIFLNIELFFGSERILHFLPLHPDKAFDDIFIRKKVMHRVDNVTYLTVPQFCINNTIKCTVYLIALFFCVARG